MSLSSLFEIILSLIFVYLVLSLVASALNEAIASFLNSRSGWLRVGIARLLGVPVKDARVDAFLSTPLVSYLSHKTTGFWRYEVSYLPARTAMLGFLSRPDLTRPGPPDPDADKQPFALQWAAIEHAVNQMQDGTPIKAHLVEMLSQADGSTDNFVKAFESWYAVFENQVRSWYRQKTHLVLVTIGIALATALNADSFAILSALSSNDRVRTEIVRLALDDKAVSTLRERADASGSAHAQDPGSQQASETRTALENDLKDLLSRLESTGLPLGWTQSQWQTVTGSWIAMLGKLLGLLVTAAAISLGAPFWFDLLGRITSIRSVGRSPNTQAPGPVA